MGRIASLGAASALIAAGTVAAIATPSLAVNCDVVDQTRGFTVFVQNDAAMAGAEVEGTVGVGGALSWASTYDVRHSTGLTPPDYDLPTLTTPAGTLPIRVAAGSLDFAGSSGELQAGSDADDPAWPLGELLTGTESWTGASVTGDEVSLTSATSGTGATVRPPAPLPTDATLDAWLPDHVGPIANLDTLFSGFPTLRSTSEQLADLSGSTDGVSEVSLAGSGGDRDLELVEGDVNILSLTPAALENVTGINFTGATPSATTTLLVKLSGGTSFTLPRLNGANDSGDDNRFAPYVLWNYPDSGALTISGTDRITGTILAPSADLTLANPSPVEGQVVAASMTKNAGTGEIHNYVFENCTPDVPVNPVGTLSGEKHFTTEGEFPDASLPDDFVVQYWIDGVRRLPNLHLNADGDPLGPVTLPAGTLVELKEVVPESVDGGDWDPVDWDVSGATTVAPTHGGDVAFTVADGAEVSVTANNNLVGEGRFSISKTVVDSDDVGGVPDDFTFHLWVNGEQQDDLVVPGDGSEVGPIDVGPNAVVELVEVAPADPDGGQWQAPALTVADAATATAEHGGFAFQVGQGSTVSAVTVTNTLVPVTPTPTPSPTVTPTVTPTPTPTLTPTPTQSSVPTPSGGGGPDDLATTGADGSLPLLFGAITVTAAGALLLLLRRRRDTVRAER